MGLGPPPSPPRTLYKILDSCKQLTLAQGAGEEDPGGMVTIITGLPLDKPGVLSGPMQVGEGAGRDRAGEVLPPHPGGALSSSSPLPLSDLSAVQETHPSLLLPPQAALQAAAHASVDIKNVLDFYKQWKEIG